MIVLKLKFSIERLYNFNYFLGQIFLRLRNTYTKKIQLLQKKVKKKMIEERKKLVLRFRLKYPPFWAPRNVETQDRKKVNKSK